MQVFCGLLFGSIALLADSVHQITDVVGLGIAYVALRLGAKGVTRRNTWGWGRADVLGALFSSILLVASSLLIAFGSVRRLLAPAEIEGGGLLVVALAGLAVNAGAALVLARVEGSLATRAAFVHLVGDAAGSAGVLLSAAVVLTVDVLWVDPVVALAIASWVGFSGIGLLRSSTRVLMNLVPPGVETADVAATIERSDGVVSVHHLHFWEIVPGELAVSAHLEVAGDMAVHDAQELLGAVRRELQREHGIGHATFEVECHPCEDDAHR